MASVEDYGVVAAAHAAAVELSMSLRRMRKVLLGLVVMAVVVLAALAALEVVALRNIRVTQLQSHETVQAIYGEVHRVCIGAGK
jgi:hypothetical protein